MHLLVPFSSLFLSITLASQPVSQLELAMAFGPLAFSTVPEQSQEILLKWTNFYLAEEGNGLMLFGKNLGLNTILIDFLNKPIQQEHYATPFSLSQALARLIASNQYPTVFSTRTKAMAFAIVLIRKGFTGLNSYIPMVKKIIEDGKTFYEFNNVRKGDLISCWDEIIETMFEKYYYEYEDEKYISQSIIERRHGAINELARCLTKDEQFANQLVHIPYKSIDGLVKDIITKYNEFLILLAGGKVQPSDLKGLSNRQVKKLVEVIKDKDALTIFIHDFFALLEDQVKLDSPSDSVYWIFDLFFAKLISITKEDIYSQVREFLICARLIASSYIPLVRALVKANILAKESELNVELANRYMNEAFSLMLPHTKIDIVARLSFKKDDNIYVCNPFLAPLTSITSVQEWAFKYGAIIPLTVPKNQYAIRLVLDIWKHQPLWLALTLGTKEEAEGYFNHPISSIAPALVKVLQRGLGYLSAFSNEPWYRTLELRLNDAPTFLYDCLWRPGIDGVLGQRALLLSDPKPWKLFCSPL